MLQCVAVCCSVLQCVAVAYEPRALRCVALCCCVLQRVGGGVAMHCGVLECVGGVMECVGSVLQ